MDLLLGENVDVRVVSLPQGEDPDSYIRKKGREEFRDLIRKAETFLQFKLGLIDEDDVSRRAKVINSVVESVQQIPDPIRRRLWFRELSRMTGIEEEVLVKYKTGTHPADRSRRGFEVPRIELELLGMMGKNIDILCKVRSALEIEDFSQPLTRKLASFLFEVEGEPTSAALLNDIEDTQLRDFLAGCLFSIESSPLGEEIVDDYIEKVRTATIDRRLRRLKKSIEEGEKEGVLDYELLKEHQRLSEMKRGV
jgi:DNA primase